MSKAIIVDLDGTLANCEHRVENGVCDHSRIHLDEVNEDLKKIIARMIVDHKLIICTARSAIWKEETEKWLESNGIRFDKLLMRNKNDKRPDYLCKYDIWRAEIRPLYDVTCVFDDNTPVVRMWRDIGLTCFQIQNTSY